jgi:hypothetical protein
MRTVLTSALTLLVLFGCNRRAEENATVLRMIGVDGRLISPTTSAVSITFSEPIEKYQLQVTSAGWPSPVQGFPSRSDDFDLIVDCDGMLEPNTTYTLKGVVEHLASGRVPFETSFTTQASMDTSVESGH